MENETNSSEQKLSTEESGYIIDPLAERRLLRKLDLTICPIFFLLYFLSFLDRANIGNARIQGMTEDLELDIGSRYNIALMVFFIPYVILELPSNIILKHVRPSLYISAIVFCWGIVNMCMGFVNNFRALTAMRFLLGAIEAGLFPGIIYLTSMYYRRFEYQRRMTVIWSAVLFSSSISGLLAFAIAHLDGKLGYRAWRWIFIIEGAATAFAGLIAVFFIPDWPEKNRFLSSDEKELLRQRMKIDELRDMERLDCTALRMILLDYKIWLSALICFGGIVTAYSMTFFLPGILNEFGWQAIDAQSHTIPIYAVAFVVLILCSWTSDTIKHRCAFIVLPYVFPTIGYSILLCQVRFSREIKYAAVFLIEIGAITTPIGITWLMNNLGGSWNRAFGAALMNTIGNSAGIVASNIFLDSEKPTYITGYGTSLACIWVSGVAAIALAAGMYFENKKRDRGGRDERFNEPPEKLANMGDHHPAFRYSL